jgi:hypothetical protein
MTRRGLPTTVAALVLAGALASAQQQLWVRVHTPDGRDVMGFAAQSEAYRAGMKPRVFEDFTSDRGAKDRQGRVISGIAFYGWAEGPTVHVVLLVRVPIEGATNRFYSSSEDANTRLERLGTYALKSGESLKLDDMKAVGMDPMSLRIESRTR